MVRKKKPVAMAAGLATLQGVAEPGFYDRLAGATEHLTDGVVARARAAGIALTCNRVGGMFGLFFTEEPQVCNFYQASQCNLDRFKLFFHGMLEQGIYLAPSAFEAGFVSAAHHDEAIQATLDAAERVFSNIA